MMRVIGIDPGLASLGWGVVELAPGRPEHVAHGVLTTPPRSGGIGKRVERLVLGLEAVLDAQLPDAAAFEAFVSYGRIVTSTLSLGNVTGAVRELLRARGLRPVEYTAREVKRAIAGSANAPKGIVARVVWARLGLAKLPQSSHAADALAVAIRHALELRVRAAAAVGGTQ